MLVLVIGGSGSGKSEYAEKRCMEWTSGEKLYIATMDSRDAESDARILRHRRLRAGKRFETLECPTHLEEAKIPSHATVLLECMSNLVANEMFLPEGRGRSAEFEHVMTELVLRGVKRLCEAAENMVIVTNQVFSDGITYDQDTERYLRVLAKINAELAVLADEVVEVVYGIPVVLK